MKLSALSNRELIDLQLQVANEVHARHYELNPPQVRKRRPGRTVDDWIQEIMQSEHAWLREQFQCGDQIDASVLVYKAGLFFDLTDDDRAKERHGVNNDGSDRIEVRWHRRFKQALRKGQSNPEFPIRKALGTKTAYILRSDSHA